MGDFRVGWMAGLAGAMLAAFAVCAQADDAPPPSGDTSSPDWHAVLGGGARWQPEVMGGKQYKMSAVPQLSVTQRDGWFLDLQEGAGKRWALAPGWSLATFLTLGDDRDEGDRVDSDTTLAGMGDIHQQVQAGLSLSYLIDDWKLQARYLGNTKHGESGQQLKLSADYAAVKTSSVVLTLNSSVSAASANYMQLWFGVDDEQAAHSDFPVYRAGGGWSQGLLGATVLVPIDQHWQAVGRVAYNRLLGSSVDSPLVRDKGYATALALLQYSW